MPIPWAAWTWALPVLTALAPSERYARTHHRRHKTLPDWAWQLLLVVRRWWPLIAVADRTYATLRLLARCQRLRRPITFITRLRLDAALYEPPHRGTRTTSDVRVARASACRAWLPLLMTSLPSGHRSPSPSGTGSASAWWRSPQPQVSGITPVSQRCHCAGC